MVVKKEDKKIKDYYTTMELVAEPWFPVRSTVTLKKLIESGKLEAYDVSTSENFKRYKILKESVDNFMKEIEKGKTIKLKAKK